MYIFHHASRSRFFNLFTDFTVLTIFCTQQWTKDKASIFCFLPGKPYGDDNNDLYSNDDYEDIDSTGDGYGDEEKVIVVLPKFKTKPQTLMVNEGAAIRLPCVVDRLSKCQTSCQYASSRTFEYVPAFMPRWKWWFDYMTSRKACSHDQGNQFLLLLRATLLKVKACWMTFWIRAVLYYAHVVFGNSTNWSTNVRVYSIRSIKKYDVSRNLSSQVELHLCTKIAKRKVFVGKSKHQRECHLPNHTQFQISAMHATI